MNSNNHNNIRQQYISVLLPSSTKHNNGTNNKRITSLKRGRDSAPASLSQVSNQTNFPKNGQKVYYFLKEKHIIKKNYS